MPQTFIIQTPDPNNPTQTISTPVTVDEETLARVRTEDPEVLSQLRTPEPGQLEALAREQDIARRQEVVRSMPIFGRLAGFGIGIANELTLGLPSALMSDEERRTFEATRREFGGSMLAGQGVGLLAPALLTGGASLEEAGAAALLPGGFSQAAGNTVERAVLARLAGSNPILARSLSVAAGAGVDGAISGAQAAVTQANIEGTPLDAESILAGVGLGAGLGLLTGGLLGAGQGVVERAGVRRAAQEGLATLEQSGQGPYARLTEDGGIEVRPPDRAGVRDVLDDVVSTPYARLVTGMSEGDVALLRQLREPGAMARAQAEHEYTAFANNISANTGDALNRARTEAIDFLRDARNRQAGFETLDDLDVAPLQEGIRGFAANIRRELDDAAHTVTETIARQGKVTTETRRVSDRLTRAERRQAEAVLQLLDEAARAPNAPELARRLDNTLARVQADRLTQGYKDTRLASAVAAAIGEGRSFDPGSIPGLESLLERMGPAGQRAVEAHRAVRDFDLAVQDLKAAGLRHNVSMDELRLNPGALFQSVSDSGYRVKNDFTEDFARVNDRAARAVDVAARQYGADPVRSAELREALRQSSNDLVEAKVWGSDIAAYRILVGREGRNAGLFAGLGLGGLGAGAAVGGLVGGVPGAVIGGVTAAGFAVATHLPSTLGRLSNLGAAKAATVTRLGEEVGRLRSVLTSGRRAAGQAVRQTPRLVLGLQSREKRRQEYRRITEQLTSLASNPQALADTLESNVGPVADVSPELAGYMSETYVRGVRYLTSNLPPADQPSVFGHLMDLEPSQAEMDAFVRRFEAVEDPLAIVSMAASYTLTADHVEAVRHVYPELFAAIQAEVTGMVSDLDKLPPYSARIQVSTLLDVPADPSYDSTFINRMQQRYAQTAAQQQQMGRGPGRPTRGSHRLAANTYSETTSLEVRLNRGT